MTQAPEPAAEQASSPLRVGILLTCHNRREITLRCLDRLAACELPVGVDLRVILVDDGSTDGTSQAVTKRHPNVEIVHGDGSLFWAGGTRTAMLRARELGLDAHVWLNDDVGLDPTALLDLVGTYRDAREHTGEMSIVVGTMRDPQTDETTYGGVRQTSRWHPLKFAVVDPGDQPKRCDAMNGNLVYIPAAVVDEIGVLSDVYVHAIGDFAYGLEARAHGAAIWTCPGYQGTCGRNDPAGTWEDRALPVAERYRKLRGPKGLPRRAYIRFLRLAGARWTWPFFYVLPYVRVAITSAQAWLRGQRAR